MAVNEYCGRKLPDENICKIFKSSQVYGTSYKTLSSKYLQNLKDQQAQRFTQESAQFIKNLTQFQIQSLDFTDEKFSHLLQDLLQHLKDNKDKDLSESCRCFHALGGTNILLSFLYKQFYYAELEQGIIKTHPEACLKNLKSILNILYCMQELLKALQSNYWFQNFLFSLLSEERSSIFNYAANVLQEINVSDHCSAIIRLRDVTCLNTVITSNLSSKQKLTICSLFSGLLSALDFMANGSDSLIKYDSWLTDNEHIVINTENRRILSEMPSFIKLVVDVACKVLKVRDFEDLHITRFLEYDHNSEEELTEEFVSGNEGLGPWYELLLYREKSSRPHSFVVLCILLMSKEKAKIHEECLRYGLFVKLKKIVEPLVWSSFNHIPHFTENDPDDALHNPDVFLKIQYLRLLHTIGDHAENKYYLLSKPEIEELKEIANTFSCEIPQLNEIDVTKCCVAEKGLIMDVLHRLLASEYNSQSSIRFWMARSLESFLRGQPCLADQMLLIRRNLVEKLIPSFLSRTVLSSDVIQCQFDLLASVMKNCVYAWVRLNCVIDCSEKFKILKNTIELNLIDSNMFVRCIILTLHHFHSQQKINPSKEFCIEKCHLLNHYMRLDVRVASICSLVNILEVNKLTQENISCLNTTITYLLIASEQNELPIYLKTINEWEENHGKVLKNLDILLNFWIHHYRLASRESDCKQLQETTGIPFEKWIQIVMLLLDKEKTNSPMTIAYYLCIESTLNPRVNLTPSCERFS